MNNQPVLALRVVALLLIAGTALLGAGCNEDGSTGPEAGFTIEDIVSDPEGMIGQEVAVSAEVGNVFRPYAFSLTSEGTDPVLVVSVAPLEVVEDSVVRAIGTVVEPPIDAQETSPDVARFVRETVEEDYQHTIVATEVHTLEEPGQL